MRVIKRDGKYEDVSFDKITRRIQTLCKDLHVNEHKIVQKVVSSMVDMMETHVIDTLSADIAVSFITEHPDYDTLASRILASNLQKKSPKCFSDAMIMNQDLLEPLFMKYLNIDIDSTIRHERDYTFSYFGIKTLMNGYLMPNETPQYMFMRVAIGIHGDDTEAAKETYNLMSKHYFIHASPTLFNAGTKHPQMSSCFLVSSKGDSIDGIYDTIKECAQISKWSGGIGVHIHDIRAKGSKIRGTNGTSDGIIPMLRVYNNTARYVNQGGHRKGAIAVYLEPWHADIMEFLDLRLNQGDEEARCRDLFTALWIPNLFMECVKNDGDWYLMCPDECPGLSDVHGVMFEALYMKYIKDRLYKKVVKARDVWSAMIKSQVETGTPYMLYKDRINECSNQKNLGTIKSSNLCVAPETKILTKTGYFQIKDLDGQSVDVWNGGEWSQVKVIKTSEQSKLIRVNMSDGTFIECTEYHKFHLQIGYGKETEIKEAQHLITGDKLIKWTSPIIQLDKETPEWDPYTHGFFCGDGTYHSTYSGSKTIPGVSLYGEKKKLVEHLDIRSTTMNEDAQGRINTLLQYNLPPKFKVPLNENIKTRLQWFAGLCDADGHTQGCPGNPTQKTISVASINIIFLREIQLMLQTLGVSSVIGLLKEAGETELPDGKGGKKMFNTQTCWRLVVSALGVETLLNHGLHTHRLDLHDFTPVTRDVRQYVRVVSIEDTGRYDETYCFNEPKKHTGIFNGMITGNCTEITEFSSPDETAVCNLASISLPALVKEDGIDYVQLGNVTRVLVRNLNKVIDKNFYPTESAYKSNMAHRPIAIGVQGLADVFQMLQLPFDSPEAKFINKRIFKFIYWNAVDESCQLAQVYGAYDSYEGSPASKGILHVDLWGEDNAGFEKLKMDAMTLGIRNSLLVAPMPTASTSQILGNNECFEPFTSNMYVRRTLAGEFVVLNKHLVKDLMDIGMWNKEIKDRIIEDNGSVQNLDIPYTMKAIYRTVWEISQKSIIDMAADRSPYIDQSQSLNLHLEDPTESKISSMHMYAYSKGLKTGMYYLRTRPKAQPIKVTLACTRDCTSCSG